MNRVDWRLIALIVVSVAGCGSATVPSLASSTNTSHRDSNQPVSKAPGNSPDSVQAVPVAELTGRRKIAPVEIGGETASGQRPSLSGAEQRDSIKSALKPLQVLLGQWKGLSRKTNSEQPEWAYDWVSHPDQPSLRMVSEKGIYIRDGRLTYLPSSDEFQLAATDADGHQRTFRGTFTEPVRDVALDEKKLQRTFKLQLTNVEPDAAGELWRVTFNQQENNRYILEVDRKRGNGPFSRVDTIHTQREGTSFALSDSDYGEKTCIISQGLGTISVNYKGRSFWVCCSGCKAAFDEDPEKWIAKFEANKKK